MELIFFSEVNGDHTSFLVWFLKTGFYCNQNANCFSFCFLILTSLVANSDSLFLQCLPCHLSYFLSFSLSLSNMLWPLDSVFGVNLMLSALRDEHGFVITIWISTSCHSLKRLSHILLSFSCLAFITHRLHTALDVSAFVISFHHSKVVII